MNLTRWILVVAGVLVILPMIIVAIFQFINLPNYTLKVNRTETTKLNLVQHRAIDSKEVVLLIHGLGASSKCWQGQISHLSTHFNVMTVDLYGHGPNSNLPDNINIKKTADNLNNQLREKGFERINVIGHSLGGLIAIEMARQETSLIDKLILLDTPTKQMGLANLSMVQYLNLKLIETNYETVIREHYKKMTTNAQLLERLLEVAEETDKYAYYSYFKSIFKTDLSETIQELNINTYLFLTKTLVNKESKLTKVKKKYGYDNISENHTYYYPDSGHFLMLEKVDKFNNDLTQILSE